MRTALVAAFVVAACTSTRGPQPPACPDADGDGHMALPCGDDCDDSDPAVHPGAPELCAGDKDENCDGHVNEGCVCSPGHMRVCYPGPAGTETVGACHPGAETCGDDGRWGACQGAVLPTQEPASCDGIDQDCNGRDDGACGCEAGGVEICGNGLDDDCDGIIDNPSYCQFSCLGVSRLDPPPELACCATEPPARTSPTCVAIAGMPPCTERACLATDPHLTCVHVCDGDACQCQLSTASGTQPDSRCGFETPCARLGCEERQHQPCYTGAPATAGKGTCKGGFTSCTDGAWDPLCDGEVLPAAEICGNHLDDDCDGLIDEEDADTGKACPPEGVCDEVETCGDGKDSDCNGRGGPGQPEDEGCCTPSTEVCNGKDDDCDGLIDEGLMGACGMCAQPCVDLSLDGDCSAPGRTCLGTTFTGGTVQVDSVAVSPSHALVGTTYQGDLVRLDTQTGEETLHQAGAGVGQVALSTDGTFWLWDGALVRHLDGSGGVLCSMNAPTPPGEVDLGMRLDAMGNPWLFTNVIERDGGLVRLRRINRTAAISGPGVPTCAFLDAEPIEVGAQMGNVYVAGAFDGAGHLWLPATRIIMRLDTSSMNSISYLTPEEPQMAAVDESDRFYVAGPAAIDRIDPIPVSFRIDGVTAMTTLGDTLWAIRNEGGGFAFVGVDAISGLQKTHIRVDSGPAPKNLALDDENRMWTLTTDLHRFDTSGGAWRTFAGERLYVTSTSTDTELRRRASRVASLQQVLDSGSLRTRWKEADFASTVPTGAGFSVAFRFADTADDLATSTRACGPFVASPANLQGCAAAAGRFARAEVVTYASPAGDSATVSGLKVLGDRF